MSKDKQKLREENNVKWKVTFNNEFYIHSKKNVTPDTKEVNLKYIGYVTLYCYGALIKFIKKR